MNNKYLCSTVLMLFLLLGFIYCEAEEMRPSNAPPQAVDAQKEVSQQHNTPAVYPRETTKHLLPSKRGALLHVAFEKGYIGKGVKLEPVVLHETYTIEVIVKPSGKQVSQATILGNICGHEEGFVIQQAAMEQNTYTMAFHNGKGWNRSVKFKLKEGTWNYLAVVFGDMQELKVYVDSSLIGTVATKNKTKNTLDPLWIGNWEWGYFPFSGSIAEVRIADSPLSEKDIKMRWNKIKPQLSKM